MKMKTLLCCVIWVLNVGMIPAGSNARLADAAKNQDKNAVRALLSQGTDVNAAQADGATALAWASYWDDVETAELLIRSGGNVNLANELGVTPLLLACTNRSVRMVETLLKAGANPNTADSNGQTPLMTCARTGSLDAVKLLLNHYTDVNSREAGHGQTALMWAAAEKNPGVVQALVERGADVNAKTESGSTPLMFAAQSGDLKSAQILVAHGADVNSAATKYGNALTVATAGHYEDLALFLLENNADPNVADASGITPLHYCMARGIAEIISAAPTSAYDASYKVRPSNMPDLAKALLAHGANPNAQIKKVLITFGTTVALHGPGVPSMVGATPLILAAISADVDVMRVLLAAGADPRLRGQGNTTPLIAAAGGAWNGYRSADENHKALEAVKLLVDLGADVNEANRGGETAMHAAAFTGANEIIQYLASKAAKVDPKSRAGETPWSIAVGISPDPGHAGLYAGHQDTADLLVKLGATAWTEEQRTAPLRQGRFFSGAYTPTDNEEK